MPEIKHTFTGGKMNKDLDERLVPNGEYRDAMNIQVRTTDGNSEGVGNAGVVQNIEGNKGIALSSGTEFSKKATKCVGCVTNDKTNSSYFLFAAPPPGSASSILNIPVEEITKETIWVDSIIEVNSNGDSSAVFIDKFAVTNTFIGVMGAQPTYPEAEPVNFASEDVFGWNVLTVDDGSRYRIGMKVYLQDNLGNHVIKERLNPNALSIPGSEIIKIEGNELTLKSVQNQAGIQNFAIDQSSSNLGGPDYPNGIADFVGWTFKFVHEKALEFDYNKKITGINIIDDLLMWTDGENEPKKINITRSKEGTPDSNNSAGYFLNPQHTQLWVKSPSLDNGDLVPITDLENIPTADIKKEHITVIKIPPVKSPTVSMNSTDRSISTNLVLDNYSFIDPNSFPSIPQSGSIKLINWPENVDGYHLGDTFTFKSTVEDEEPVVIRAKTVIGGNGNYTLISGTGDQFLYLELTYVDPNLSEANTFWTINFEQKLPLFETKFGRFAYRYQYEDNEYSTFSPWSELVFLPSNFSYTPSKGFNNGMVNTVRQLIVRDFIPDDLVRPNDVKAVDLLWKTTDNNNVYVIKTLRREIDNEWIDFTNPDNENTGYISITSEMIHRVLPNNQLIRGWDNVPKSAIAQEITGNRLIFGNYTQGYNIENAVGLFQEMKSTNIAIGSPYKSVKSIREYKFGMVFGDKYGRETPVIANGYSTAPTEIIVGDNETTISTTGDIVVKKTLAQFSNQFTLKQNWEDIGADPPEWMEYVKFYVKETSNEYYNLIMDRWYEAEDGNVWLSFPSADRNKVDEDTYLILKNEHGTQAPVVERAKYKVVAIESEAPDYIKTDNRLMGEMLINRRHIYGPGAGQEGDYGESNVTNADPRELYNDRFIYTSTVNWDRFNIKREDFKGTMKARIVGKWYNGNPLDSGVVVQARGESPWVTVSRLITPITDADGVNADIQETDWGGVVLKRKFERSEVDMYMEIAQNQGNSSEIDQAVVDNEGNPDFIWYSLEFKDEVVENKPEFDGRFFVKIEKDDIIRRRICHEHGGEFVTDFSFNIAYIEPSANNNANVDADSAGAYENWEWGDASGVPAGQAIFNGWAAADVEAGFAASDASNNTTTEAFWNWWMVNRSTNIFLDGSKAFSMGNQTWPNIADMSGQGAIQYQNALISILGLSGTAELAALGGPTGLDQISNTGNGLTANSSQSGQFGVMWFSTVGENFEDDLANVFKSRMQMDSTLFRFKQDPHGTIYRVVKWNEEIPENENAWNFNFPNNENNLGQALNYSGGSGEDASFRNSIMVTFVALDANSNQSDGAGINITLWDPRGALRHDGITTSGSPELTIEFVTRRASDELSDDAIISNNACWETEPKEDVGLDIYYEASDGFPLKLKSNNLQNYIGASKIRENASKVVLQARTLLPAEDENVPAPMIESFELSGDPYVYSCHGDNIVLIKRDDPEGQIGGSINFVPNATPISYVDNINRGGLAIDDVIEFHHKDGTITRSKIINHMTENINGDIVQNVTIVLGNSGNLLANPIGENNYGINPTTQVGSIYMQGSLSLQATQLIDMMGFLNYGIEVLGEGIQKGTFLTSLEYPQLFLSKPPTQLIDNVTITLKKVSGLYQIDTEVYKYPVTLSWFNCYSFGNGVESNRIRDDFNAPKIDNGIKASSTYLEYGEETKGSGLIYSGLYNSTSGTNELNQFNIGEKITKDLNPSYGSIQALKTRDTNLVTFTEDKVLKVLSNKDAVFNADGNPQLTATNRVLGQAIPFAGDYGISKNPESLASDQYRLYFTDKQRGAVLRLSNDGITPISNIGMKSWFRENLKKADTILGTYDIVNGEYNVTLGINSSLWIGDDPTTVSFNEGSKGWVSFKSFLPDAGLSINGKYLTAYSIIVYQHYHELAKRNTFYGRFNESEIEVVFNDLPGVIKSFKTVNYEGTQSKVIKHTNINNSTEESTFTDAAGNIITDLTDGNYYNLEEKEGWSIDLFTTDMQIGKVPEFIQKENKWFNRIIGGVGAANESEFSVQGLGFPLEVSTVTPEETEITVEGEPLSLSTWEGPTLGSYLALNTTTAGGVYPYTYAWSTSDGDIAGTPTSLSSVVFSNGPGTYTVTVTDSVGNQISGSFEIE